MGYDQCHWWKIPKDQLFDVIQAIDERNKLWLADKFITWRIQGVDCATCPSEIERIWDLFNTWYQRKTEIELNKLAREGGQLDRTSLEMLVYHNFYRLLLKDPKLLQQLQDKELKQLLAKSLYYCNVEKLNKPVGQIFSALTNICGMSYRTLHRWLRKPE